MLRALPQAEQVAALLGEALAATSAVSARPVQDAASIAVPAAAREHGRPAAQPAAA
jgi:hypothetical protein